MSWGAVGSVALKAAPAVLGAAAGYLGSQGQGGEETLASEISGLALAGYNKDLNQYRKADAPQFFGDQTYADQSQYSQNAIQGMGNFSTQPSQDYYSSVMGGDYLGLNPAMQNAVMNPAMDAVANRFNMYGRNASPGSEERMANAAMEAYMPFYNAERDRMGQAAQGLPQMQQAQYSTQLQGGTLDEAYRQQPIDEAMARWDYEQNLPFMQMERQAGLMQPFSGALNTGYEPQDGSGVSAAMGGAMIGQSIADSWNTPSANYDYSGTPALQPAGMGMPSGVYDNNGMMIDLR